jgi:hypothetical protein
MRSYPRSCVASSASLGMQPELSDDTWANRTPNLGSDWRVFPQILEGMTLSAPLSGLERLSARQQCFKMVRKVMSALALGLKIPLIIMHCRGLEMQRIKPRILRSLQPSAERLRARAPYLYHFTCRKHNIPRPTDTLTLDCHTTSEYLRAPSPTTQSEPQHLHSSQSPSDPASRDSFEPSRWQTTRNPL